MNTCKSCKINEVEEVVQQDIETIDGKCQHIPEETLPIGNCSDELIDNEFDPLTEEEISSGCVMTTTGKVCPDTSDCTMWDLTQDDDDCIVADYIEEQLNIAGTNLHVHKLLGIHEQAKLMDITGNGRAISSGEYPNNPASNAFDKYITEWKSTYTGEDVVRYAYIGYDFGPVKMSNGRDRYALPTEVVKDVASFKIMQGCNSENRVTRFRVERSENGIKWYGAAIVNVEDCDGLTTVTFRRTVPSRFWRLRPIQFNGGESDTWVVRALQLSEFERTNLRTIQDKILMENRDRDYAEESVLIKATYTPQEYSTMFERLGFNQMGDVYSFDVSFNSCVKQLGRPIVIGDILMVESERQYSSKLRPIDKYLEVTDVLWSATGFTPSWKPTVHKIIAKPLLASQETQDIAGKLTVDFDRSNLFDLNDGTDGKKYQDYMDISDNIRAKTKTDVPVKGEDASEVPVISRKLKEYGDSKNIDMNKLNRSPNIFNVDALPPNGLPFTIGDEFPKNPKNNDYHRLTYVRLGNSIPARLYRYSDRKGRWIYLETDRKGQINEHRPQLVDFTVRDSTKTPLNKISETLEGMKSKD